MKRSIHVFFVYFLFHTFCFGGKIKQTEIDQSLNWTFFDKYAEDASKRNIIEKYWKQYFLKDIYKEITEEKESDFHCLFYDSYGGLYPDEDIMSDVVWEYLSQNKKNGKELRNINLCKYSWYWVYYNVMATNTDDSFAQKIRSDNRYKTFLESPIFENNDKDKFYQLWDEMHLNSASTEIREKLKSKQNVVFFAHGYNVPYSLAVIQGKTIVDVLCSNGLDRDSTLFIPIFWPSNDQKNCSIEDISTFDVRDKNKPGQGGLNNGVAFLYYASRAYYVALSVRQLLCKIEEDLKGKNLFFIAHSLGTIIPTTALINNSKKLQDLDNGEISKDIAKLMKNDTLYRIPKLKMSIFLSAPAMPGTSTFCQLEKENFDDVYVYSTTNIRDRMITKNIIPCAKKWKKKAVRLNATSLGMNWNYEAEKVQILFLKKNLTGHFIFKEVSDREDHDIFTYLRQKEYVDFLEEFIKSNP